MNPGDIKNKEGIIKTGVIAVQAGRVRKTENLEDQL